MAKLTEEQKVQYMAAARFHSMGGRSEIAGPIRAAVRDDEEYAGDPSHLRTDGVSPLVNIPDLPPPPPVHGNGSSGKNWKEWAKLATDFDDEVIEGSSKDELVAMLRANGVIPKDE